MFADLFETIEQLAGGVLNTVIALFNGGFNSINDLSSGVLGVADDSVADNA